MIYTVIGPIEKEQMGRTLSHEHFDWICEEEMASKMYFDKEYDEDYNQIVAERVLPVLRELKAAGCGTIVETSPPIAGQNVKLLYDLSKKTGTHIIPCTGTNITKYAYRIFPEGFRSSWQRNGFRTFKKGWM